MWGSALGPPSGAQISETCHCSSQPSMVHWLSSPIFPCLFGCSSRHGNTPPNLTSSCPRPPKLKHFLKAYDDSCLKMNKEHKYKDKDEYKDNDRDKDAERITESLAVCYIFGILTTQAFQVSKRPNVMNFRFFVLSCPTSFLGLVR